MNNIYVDMVGDLFHINHINLIKEAKKFGKYLIVGVHSDKEKDLVLEMRDRGLIEWKILSDLKKEILKFT